eukprot:360381-Chlamydomonas_euryale.AAC.7
MRQRRVGGWSKGGEERTRHGRGSAAALCHMSTGAAARGPDNEGDSQLRFADAQSSQQWSKPPPPSPPPRLVSLCCAGGIGVCHTDMFVQYWVPLTICFVEATILPCAEGLVRMALFLCEGVQVFL